MEHGECDHHELDVRKRARVQSEYQQLEHGTRYGYGEHVQRRECVHGHWRYELEHVAGDDDGGHVHGRHSVQRRSRAVERGRGNDDEADVQGRDGVHGYKPENVETASIKPEPGNV